jgi:dTDP-4-amino-4,6-dideoxygalactose transaminase
MEALESGWLSCGPKVVEFEEAIAKYVDAPAACATSSCTTAMEVALASLGVGPGDAVFVPTWTFPATANAALHRGATVVLVGVEADLLTIDPEALELAVRSCKTMGLRPRAVMPVHFAGHPFRMSVIDHVAAAYGLEMIEDAAHAFGASDVQRVGAVRDDGVVRLTAFSFYATKNLTTGEGGMLTGPEDLIADARKWRLHGMTDGAWERYEKPNAWYFDVEAPGYKANLTDPQAAMGLAQLARFDEMQERRTQIAERYHDGLLDSVASQVQLPYRRSLVTHAWHLYPIRLDLQRLSIDRDEVIRQMAERKISCNVHFTPLHLLSSYSLMPYAHVHGDVAGREYERILSLPLHPGLCDQDVDDVIEALSDVLETYGR